MTVVYRVYVEKRAALAVEAQALFSDLKTLLNVEGLETLRLFNRYDVQGVDEALFDLCVKTVFSEPQTDLVYEILPEEKGALCFAVEYLPGQFDQRADSAAQCVQILSQKERPLVRTARVYQLTGTLSEQEIAAVKDYLINPIESREASLLPYETLELPVTPPEKVAVLDGFCALDEAGLIRFHEAWGLAMDLADLHACQNYFQTEARDPTVTELRVIDTYWSDHCRHTTFLTQIDEAVFDAPLIQKTYEDYLALRKDLGREKPVSLMDLGTIVGKHLRRSGQLLHLDESEEVNACTVKIKVSTDAGLEDWLLLFKNETHNHPTEIEPFGGAATCIGGAIRDPLSGRSYVYAAMRVTGAADPRKPVSETLPGKLPQRSIVTRAAAGYSSYGNQIGLPTGQVDEIYHPGYEAKRMEVGAVIGAAPAENVRREQPAAGDLVILLGGRTGRDGCGGATGSSKSHTTESLETGGAEVQKGNAPEERKIQRLFRRKEASLLIKRCNDFGAGGVCVAIGELADGLAIELDAVPKKYEGLDGTELAISESQERMAVVVEAGDAARFLALAGEENLEATVVAEVTAARRLIMHWQGDRIVDISRDFLDSNGAEKHSSAKVLAPKPFAKEIPAEFSKGFLALAADLNVCSKRGLTEQFDSSIGSGTVLMPLGGKYQLTPPQAMVHKIATQERDTDSCSLMAWGYNPFISSQSPYHGAYLAVVESVAKLVATGASLADTYLSFQEYFERLGREETRWGKPLAALLGAFRAQMELSIAAIGGKDSMSGSFEEMDVPPTLISFSVTTDELAHILSPEFKAAGHKVFWLRPDVGADGLPKAESLRAVLETVTRLGREEKIHAACTPTYGGIAQAVLNMAAGNRIGFSFAPERTLEELFAYQYGSFVLECSDDTDPGGLLLGTTQEEELLSFRGESLPLSQLFQVHEETLETIYPSHIPQEEVTLHVPDHRASGWMAPRVKYAKPRVLVPVFPGTNTEYDAERALRAAGAVPEIVVIRNLTAAQVSGSVEAMAKAIAAAQVILIPGGFSGGDEPDGSAKLITSFFRNAKVREATDLLLNERDGLICGICNGFQALIKLGLVPFGRIMDTDEHCPTLTHNAIGRHQSRIVRTRIASNLSPWLMECEPGEVYSTVISHGEGRFLASETLLRELLNQGQIATQYVDFADEPSGDILFNPSGSLGAVEGITSPDGRVLGKMGHTERLSKGIYKNVPGNYDMGLFRGAVRYFD